MRKEVLGRAERGGGLAFPATTGGAKDAGWTAGEVQGRTAVRPCTLARDGVGWYGSEIPLLSFVRRD